MLRTFHYQGIAFRYYDADNGKKPLVFQHGLTGDHLQILSSFTNRDYRLITLECRGHGRSHLGPVKKLSHATFTDDLHALLIHLGIDRAAFAGISMGAAIAANFAARHPEKVTHLAMVRPAWFDRAFPENMAAFGAVCEFLARFGAREGRRRFVRSEIYQKFLGEAPDNAASLAAAFTKGSREKMLALLGGFLVSDPCFDAETLAALPVPKQVLGTSRDIIHPMSLARRIADTLPGAEYVELFSKSEDAKRHAEELTAAIVRLLER